RRPTSSTAWWNRGQNAESDSDSCGSDIVIIAFHRTPRDERTAGAVPRSCDRMPPRRPRRRAREAGLHMTDVDHRPSTPLTAEQLAAIAKWPTPALANAIETFNVR